NKIFTNCISIIRQKLNSVNIWPSREQVNAFMPPAIHKSFPTCRVIIDCTELYVEQPSNPTHQQSSFSYFKKHNTYKSLIGIAPSGGVSFISDLWLGSISDKEITMSSGILDKLEAGETVLADRGFTVLENEFVRRDVTLFTPFFLQDKIQFPLDERCENKKASSHRCHVEHTIGRIKSFKILDGIISWNLKNIVDIHYICAFLTNFS
ncbi:unnamed protein product, partial [Lymnaea stagnalis]